MSANTLSSHVPLLDGVNGPTWFTKMKAWLQAQNLWTTVIGDDEGPIVPDGKPERPAMPNEPSGNSPEDVQAC
jgi:hypothetical protein